MIRVAMTYRLCSPPRFETVSQPIDLAFDQPVAPALCCSMPHCFEVVVHGSRETLHRCQAASMYVVHAIKKACLAH
jgi:hypothetical protein